MRNRRALGAALLLLLFGVAAAGMLAVVPLAVVRRAPQATPTPSPTPTPTATPSPTATPTPTPAPAPKPALCIGPREVPYYYAGLPNKEHAWSFGPSAEPNGPRSLSGLKTELTRRLCGTAKHGGDERLYIALHAAIYGGDPNARISHSEWARGVPKLLIHMSWTRGTHVMRYSGSWATMAMEPRGGTDSNPVVHAATSHMHGDRVLVLALLAPRGPTAHRLRLHLIKVKLRLKCGFQPEFRTQAQLPAAL